MVVLETRKVKARKEHKCCLCHGAIKKGETYTRQKNIFDGVLWTWKTHPKCDRISVLLDMWDCVDDGLDEDTFSEILTDRWSTEFPSKDIDAASLGSMVDDLLPVVEIPKEESSS